MGSLSNYGENYFINHLLNAAQTSPSTVYLVLCSADPTDAATGASCNEIANAGGYARTEIFMGTAVSRRTTQAAQLLFPQATAAWGPVSHWALADGAVYGAGNILATGAFTEPFSPVAGNTPRIDSGEVYVEITAKSGYGYSTYCANEMLDHMFNNNAFPSPAGSTAVALINVIADDNDSVTTDLTEVSGNNYSRAVINANGGASPAWSLASAGASSNASQVNFAIPGVDGWTETVGLALVDALSGTANVIAYNNADVVDQTPAENDEVYIPANGLVLSMS